MFLNVYWGGGLASIILLIYCSFWLANGYRYQQVQHHNNKMLWHLQEFAWKIQVPMQARNIWKPLQATRLHQLIQGLV